MRIAQPRHHLIHFAVYQIEGVSRPRAPWAEPLGDRFCRLSKRRLSRRRRSFAIAHVARLREAVTRAVRFGPPEQGKPAPTAAARRVSRVNRRPNPSPGADHGLIGGSSGAATALKVVGLWCIANKPAMSPQPAGRAAKARPTISWLDDAEISSMIDPLVSLAHAVHSNAERDAWPPLAAGLFGGSFERFS
jgi:hypothetical protein